jgi:hypothetical protein
LLGENEKVGSNEAVIRLLFHHRMVSEIGILSPEAFPTDELIEKGGKSVSVDRSALLKVPEQVRCKLVTYERPDKGRAKWGYAESVVQKIEGILDADGRSVFSVFADPLENFPPSPWDHAHAKVVRADASFGKGFVRGYRDKLIEAFQASVTPLD